MLPTDQYDKASYEAGVKAAIAIVLERDAKIKGAIQPDITVEEIRKRLLG